MNVNPITWAASTLRLFTRIDNDGVNTTVPVTEIKELPIGVPDMDIALLAKGTGATLAQVPDGTDVGGNKRGIYATDWQKVRLANTQVASGAHSFIGGGSRNTASGTLATVGGGNGHSAIAPNSFVGGGSGNSATGTTSTVGGGNINTASSTNSFVGGGSGNNANGTSSTVGGGSANTASAANSTVCGGQTNTANGIHSFIGGGRRGTTRSIVGYHVFPACDVPISDSNGVTQSALVLLARQTTDETATVLASNTSAASQNNQVTLPNNSAYYFKGSVIAGVTSGGDSKAWSFEGAIKRGANAASTAIVGSVVLNTIAQDSGASAWSIAITANTTLGCITVTVTGAAATTIRWVAKLETTEMSF